MPSSIVDCITDISTWMNSNMLKLNKDKTEFFVFSSKQHVKKTENLRITVGSRYINSFISVRNLGLTLDNTLGMEKQVNFIYKSCYYQIRNIGLIGKYINDETCSTLVQTLIISRLDYGNALLYNIPLSLTNLLQQAQNCAACLVTRTRKREHITPVFFHLHWLPVHFRSLYKILCHTFNVLSEQHHCI